jgi:hypothetical protein
VTSSADVPSFNRPELAAFTPTVSVTSSGYDQDGGDTVFEGDLSLAAHTAFASEFLENAVEHTSLSGTHPGMSGVVASLRQMVNMQDPQVRSHEPNFPHQKPLPPGGLRELPMPPMQLVIALPNRDAHGDFRREALGLRIPYLEKYGVLPYFLLVLTVPQ